MVFNSNVSFFADQDLRRSQQAGRQNRFRLNIGAGPALPGRQFAVASQPVRPQVYHLDLQLVFAGLDGGVSDILCKPLLRI